MPSSTLIDEHREVQNAAKAVLTSLAATISEADTEESIAEFCIHALRDLGFPDTWYYACPAFVLSGARSCLSISGREYVPGREIIGQFNLVTVDLSPTRNGHWGDCARSFYIENGCNQTDPTSPELRDGKNFIASLHEEMKRTVYPEMSFHELFEWTNHRIKVAGFENLDFLGNVGRSIATRREDRQYVAANNGRRLSDVPFFTFEPNVCMVAGRWGFKHENIFSFDEAGQLTEL